MLLRCSMLFELNNIERGVGEGMFEGLQLHSLTNCRTHFEGALSMLKNLIIDIQKPKSPPPSVLLRTFSNIFAHAASAVEICQLVPQDAVTIWKELRDIHLNNRTIQRVVNNYIVNMPLMYKEMLHAIKMKDELKFFDVGKDFGLIFAQLFLREDRPPRPDGLKHPEDYLEQEELDFARKVLGLAEGEGWVDEDERIVNPTRLKKILRGYRFT
eukprot:TRINITY_DN11644_c0_g1_i1.p1 TRINITY_DN11644_c0_g1~~TRINITY_DN11644_c0_g1_i1.p1  ORF type:complete len:213 (-),score=42.76 TRINITY_DN11644_c0_g1_i1:107-745(-)